jgi:hypothetical protein
MRSSRYQAVIDTARGARLVDEVLRCYVAWRNECETARAGYEAWCSGAEEERTIRFAAYNAAVDREERAARCYAESIDALRYAANQSFSRTPPS